MKATNEPWKAPISTHAPTASRIAISPGTSNEPSGSVSLATTTRDAADVADREVDLADQEHEDDAVGEQRRARHLREDVGEVAGAEEVLGLEGEEGDDHDQPDQDRPAAEVAAADVVEHTLAEALLGMPDSTAGASTLTGGSGAVCGMPDTFVGTPA